MDQLRHDSRVPFEGLPPVEQVALAGPASHRYVRQDDPLWWQLHAGVLSTGLLRGALGLYEKSTAKKLGIPNSRVGHEELLRAYHHLRHVTADTAPDAAADAAAAAHNAAAVLAFNAAKGQASPEAGGNGSTAARPQAVVQGASRDACVVPPAAAAATEGGGGGKSKGAKRRRQKQTRAAAAAALAGGPDTDGPAAAAAAWGVSEEMKQKKARALASLGLLSIGCSWGSAQEAAALLQVAAAFPTSQLAEVGLCRLQPHLLPAAWGFDAGSLPPMGASPDALIWHRAPGGAGAAAPASGGAAAAGAAAQAGAAAAQLAIGPWDIDGLLQRLQLAGLDGAAASSVCGSTVDCVAGRSSSGSSSSGGGDWIEVIEVKNTSPFGHSRRGGRLRTTELAVVDRGPRQAVPPEWVPQLQLHMLCAGTSSGLLVSRSATKGTRIFRMRRDDDLLRLILAVLSRLWQQHVLPGRPPPPDVYASWREHHDMSRRIVEVPRSAELVASVEQPHHLPGGDARWFLD